MQRLHHEFRHDRFAHRHTLPHYRFQLPSLFGDLFGPSSQHSSHYIKDFLGSTDQKLFHRQLWGFPYSDRNHQFPAPFHRPSSASLDQLVRQNDENQVRQLDEHPF